MLVWFATLAILGAVQIVLHPSVLAALDPRWALGLFEIAGWQAFVALGAVVLAVTGAEALYADMGHFGRQPIRVAWLGLVLPALVLNYFGQGALVLRDPAALDHPFYRLAPDWLLWPLIGLATMATIIASQAVISGVFSLTRQAVRLGHLSRMTIRAHLGHRDRPGLHPARQLAADGRRAGRWSWASARRATSPPPTASRSPGPWRSTRSSLASSPPIAGAGVRWSPASVFGAMLLIDLAYFSANALKIPSGGWLPLAVAALFLFTVLTWRRGREVLRIRLYGEGQSVKAFLAELDPMLHRAPGTAVFMTGNPHQVPVALLHNLRRNNVVHERVVILTVRVRDEPHVPAAQRVLVEKLGKGFYRVVVSYGFVDDPDVPRALELCRPHGVPIDLELTSYFLSRETLVPSADPELNPVEERLFILLSASNLPATAYFGIPPNQVVELGIRVEI